MKSYYFVGTSLPDLYSDKVPEITFAEFDRLLKDNLSPGDYEQSQILRLGVDIENIRMFLKDRELDSKLDPRGNLNAADIEEAVLARGYFPSWIDDFLEEYDSSESRLKHFPKLWASFFQYEIPKTHGFLKKYLEFERGLRLTLAAFRAKKLGRDLSRELQYEDPEDPLVSEILAQKDSKTYTPPSEFEEIAPILEEWGDEPEPLAKALSDFRFNKIEEMVELEVFSIDRLLAYMAELLLLEKRIDLESEMLLDKIINAKDLKL